MPLNQREQTGACAIAKRKPDKFWRRTVEQGALVKILVLRDDGETVDAGLAPDFFVRVTHQSKFAHVQAAGEGCCQETRQLGRKIFVEQQLHAATVSGRSR